jgi:hypothetical protein
MPKVAMVSCEDLPSWEIDDRPLWQCLKDRGVEVLHPNWSDKKFDWSQCDLVLPRTTWDYQQQVDEFLSWMCHVDEVSCLLNPRSVMEWNLDKRYLQSFVEDIPPTCWLAKGEVYSLDSFRNLCASRGWQRAFLKPCVGASSWGTFRFDLEDSIQLSEAVTHVNHWLQTHNMMLQPYFTSVEERGEFSCIFFEHIFSHAVKKVPVRGDYRVQDDFGASDFAWQASADMLAICQRVLSKLSVPVLYARCDFLLNDQGHPRLIELELIEPSLFFRHESASPARLANAIVERISNR